jgi:hypothetical protein
MLNFSERIFKFRPEVLSTKQFGLEEIYKRLSCAFRVLIASKMQ